MIARGSQTSKWMIGDKGLRTTWSNVFVGATKRRSSHLFCFVQRQSSGQIQMIKYLMNDFCWRQQSPFGKCKVDKLSSELSGLTAERNVHSKNEIQLKKITVQWTVAKSWPTASQLGWALASMSDRTFVDRKRKNKPLAWCLFSAWMQREFARVLKCLRRPRKR